MKIRTGFVSNSSSSSFIIGIVNNGKDGSGEVFYPNENLPWFLEVRDLGNDKYELYIESFTGREVSCKIKEGDRFEYLDATGPDGDEHFTEYDSDGDFMGYDYDVDIEDFDEDDISTYESILDNGGEVAFGAGRDG